MVVLSLVQNTALLVALAAIYRVLMARVKAGTTFFKVLTGFLFGAICLVGMMTPMNFSPGIIFDGRSIILSVAGLFTGPIAAFIAAIIASVYRISLGGSGAWVGVAVIFEAAFIGVIFYYLRSRQIISMNLPTLWVFSFLVHAGMLALQMALPGGSGAVVINRIGIPILVLFPLASVLVCLLFLDSETQIRDRSATADSEKALKRAQQVAHVGSWTWYIQQNKVEWSDEMYRIFGIEKSKFSGNLAEVISNAIHPDDQAAVEASNRSVIEKSQPLALEYRIVWPDKTIRTVWAEAGELNLDHNGSPLSLTGIVQDITDWRNAEKELRESEARYRNLIIHSPDAIFVNHNDRVVLVNHACEKLFGANNSEELIGKSPYDLFHPDFHEQINNRIHHLRELGEPVPIVQERIVRLDGTVVDVDVLAAPFSSHGSNDIHVILRDITERKQMEEALRKSFDMLARLAEQVPGVVYQYRLYPDGSSCFPYSSPGMEEIYEVTPEEVREDATPVFGRLHPEDYDYISESIFESARTLNLYHSEFRVILPRQGLRWRLCNAKPERTEDGGTLWYGIITDITERKQAEEKINEQLEELRKWQSIMLGRENRIIELKEEVNQLMVQTNQPIRYGSVDRSASVPDGKDE